MTVATARAKIALDRMPAWCAVAVRTLAVLTAVSALVPPLRRYFEDGYDAVSEVLVSVVPNLGYAAFLFVLAASLERRKRGAWWLLVLGLAAHEVVHVLRAATGSVPAAAGAAVGVGLLVAVVPARRRFFVVGTPGGAWRAAATFVALFGAGSLLGAAVVARQDEAPRTFGGSWAYAMGHMLGGLGAGDVFRGVVVAHWVDVLLDVLGAAAVLGASYVLLRPPAASRTLAPDDEQRLHGLLDRWGGDDSLGYFALRRDKAAVWSASGKSAVAYRVVAGASLASGDPLGDPEAWPGAIDAWLGDARRHGWAPAVIGAGERAARAYARRGLDAFEIGDEAILDVADFSLDGRAMRGVRQAVHRARRAGYTIRVRRQATIPEDDLARLAAAADDWRDTETERGFSMALGRLGDPSDGQCVVVEALAPDGTVHGLLTFVPWGADGLSLDLMRRDRDVEHGLVELMVAELVAAAPGLGVRRLSLNFAMFRSALERGGDIGAGPVLRVWRAMLVFASRWWQIESLYRANAKFHPAWEPRYLCFEQAADLPRIGVAALVAEGFLDPPGTSALFRRRRAARRAACPAPRGPGEGAPRSLALGPVTEPTPAPPTAADLPEQERVRREKRARLLERGIEPYPVGFPRTTTLGDLRAAHPDLAPGAATGERVAVTGRVMLLRNTGKLCFATIQDGSGSVQVMLSLDRVGREALDAWKRDVDLGDHVGVEGEVIASRRGELSVMADRWMLTAKCLRPLPEKHRGLTDPEARVRQRYVDLIVNPEARRMLHVRADTVASLRRTLSGRGFVEVETPMLQPVHGGANARPFVTHINAYDMSLYLRIAPELYLKRLVVGGVEKVFEINRNFRNEGADSTHNPEFTMLEAYEAYGDYDTMRVLTQQLIQQAALDAIGTTVVQHVGADGTVSEHDIGGDWPVVTVNAAISAALGEEVTADTPLEQLRKLCDAADVPYDPGWPRGAVVLEMYERLVEDRTARPTFYKDYPVDVSPLTRQHRDDPRLAERWDLVAFGAEIGTAYSELVDPVEQRARLTAQSLLAAGGDAEAMQLDEDFLRALEYAMPPSGGMGMGVDRLLMLLTGRNIRDTVLFPLVKPGS